MVQATGKAQRGGLNQGLASPSYQAPGWNRMPVAPAAAQAINLNPIQTFLQTIVTALTGTLGKTIATLALVCVCIGWFMGYIESKHPV